MEAFKNFVTAVVPQYLSSLPLPDDFQGFAKLTQPEWIALAPLFVFVLAISFILNALISAAANGPIIGNDFLSQRLLIKSLSKMMKKC